MKRIFIYGNGILSGVIQELINPQVVNVLGIIVDKDYLKESDCNGKLIIAPEELENYDYNYIIIASSYYDKLKQRLLNIGVDKRKIIATEVHQSKEFKNFLDRVRLEFESEFNQTKLNDLLLHNIYEPVHLSYMNPANRKKVFVPNNSDYVRYSTLELTATRIKEQKVVGEVAEVGVFRGDFAASINGFFPDKKLYLFDTFEGFSNNDIELENSRGFSKNIYNQFNDTSIELVLSKMKTPENCIIKKGYFPKTADDVDCNFAFVSLDADLYSPIYYGLQFFYSRLSKGGAIFIHDYLNNNFKGVRAATDKFCTEENITIQIISDFYGTAIINK